MNLIIVESPTKAKTITRFLGDNFLVESCQGHIRDLPKGKLGIEVENDFTPQYVIPTKKRKIVNQLKKIAKKADQIYFATDEDRAGESIAWHLDYILKAPHSQRIAFHEITSEAIKESLKSPRKINLDLVQAQQTRRILDRLVGYKLSPLLWKKIFKGLSAGRVQSPAVRLIVDREKEINDFKPQEYWSLQAELMAQEKIIWANLIKKNNLRIEKLDLKSKKQIEEIIKDLTKATYVIENIKIKEVQKAPRPPFITSTLQQEANNCLGFSTKQTMMIAQQLYEGVPLGEKTNTGLITYMRTDSLSLSQKFINESATLIKKEFGSDYQQTRHYQSKSKLAQEAHEAIRPVSCQYPPDKIASYLNKNQFKLYDLIWRRALASQMSNEILESMAVDIKAKEYTWRANGLTIKFLGWAKLYPEKQKENLLPLLKNGQVLALKKLHPSQHFTEPPGRYTEASLVKTLEKHGIGRPSTYASIISTIQTRNYINKKGKALFPTKIGILVNDFLTKHFPEIVDYKFTALLEDQLDQIAQNKKEPLKILQEFYQPFIKEVKMKEENIKKTFKDEETDKICPQCGQPLVIKTGRFGKFLACTGFPECRYTKSLSDENGNSVNEKIDIPCPKCGGEIVKKRTKKGKFFFGCSGWPKCDFALWDEPVAEKCPDCDSLMVKKGEKIVCPQKDCPGKKKQKKD